MSKVNIPCLWQVEFIINPSLKKNETIEDYIFNVKDGKTFVKYDYSTTHYDGKIPGSSEYEYAEQTIANIHMSNIRTLMLERMIYQKIFRDIKIEIVSNPMLINREELKNENLLKRRPIGISLESSYHRLDVGDSLEESQNFWKSGFKNKTIGLEQETIRIAEWFQRSEIESNATNSFIFSWIGFNGLYGLFNSIDNKKDNDADKFEYMIDELLDKKLCEKIIINNQNILNELQSYGIKSDNGNKNWSNELKKERDKPSPDSVKIIKYALRCIYGIRKQVFHEAPRPIDIDLRIKNCRQILKSIATKCLKNFINY